MNTIWYLSGKSAHPWEVNNSVSPSEMTHLLPLLFISNFQDPIGIKQKTYKFQYYRTFPITQEPFFYTCSKKDLFLLLMLNAPQITHSRSSIFLGLLQHPVQQLMPVCVTTLFWCSVSGKYVEQPTSHRK